MTLQEAIEILELNLKLAGPQMPPDCKAAVKLGIEAGKRIQANRRCEPEIQYLPLPGETTE